MKNRNLKRKSKRQKKNRMLKKRLQQLYAKLARLEKMVQNLQREMDEKAND